MRHGAEDSAVVNGDPAKKPASSLVLPLLPHSLSSCSCAAVGKQTRRVKAHNAPNTLIQGATT